MRKFVEKLVAFFIIYFLFLLNVVSAQNADACALSLSGQVFDDEHGMTLPGATIAVKETGVVSVSDEYGKFSIPRLCPGIYTVSIRFIGYENFEYQIYLEDNLNRKFFLKHDTRLLDDAIVQTLRITEKNTINKMELRGIDLEKTRGMSLADALKEIPGVTTLQTGPTISKPVIQGMHSNRILIINNGIRQQGQQWGSEHAPEIDAFIANKLTVIKGAGSIRYGSDAIGGVILVEPNILTDSVGIGGEVNMVGISNGRQGVFSGMLEGKFIKLPEFSWRIQGTVKQAGNIKTPDYYLKNSGFKEFNFSWAANYTSKNSGAELFYSQFNTNIAVFAGAHIGNLTDLERAFSSPIPLVSSGFSYTIDRPMQEVVHELFKVKTYFITGENSKLNLVVARQYNLRNEYDKDKPRNDSLAALNRPELHYEITTHSGDLSYDHRFLRVFRGTIGIALSSQSNTLDGRAFIPNFIKQSWAAYWIERIEKEKLDYEFGLRYDYEHQKIYRYKNAVLESPERNFSNVSFNVGTNYKLRRFADLSLNIGTAYRPPGINELYGNGVHHGEAKFLTADENLNPEHAYVAIAGLKVSDEKRLYGQVDLYYKLVDGYIYLNPLQKPVLTIRGAFPAFEYKQKEARFVGMDAWLKFRLTEQLRLFSKSNMIRAYNQSDGGYIPFIPSDRFEQGIEYDLKDADFFEKTQISLALLTVLKQTRLQDNSDYKGAPNAYQVLNFNLSSSLHIGEEHLELGFSINNVLNTKYREYMNAFRYFSDEPGRSFVLRVKYHF